MATEMVQGTRRGRMNKKEIGPVNRTILYLILFGFTVVRAHWGDIGGMTPAELTFRGRCVDCPPYIFLPTTRLAY